MVEKFNMPWEDRPAGCTDVMWRYSKNPVIGRYQIPSSNSIFNSAVVPYKDGFAGVFRCDNKAVQMNIFAGFSKDGIHFSYNSKVLTLSEYILLFFRLCPSIEFEVIINTPGTSNLVWMRAYSPYLSTEFC